MKARVKWVEGMAFVGEAGSGHAVVMDSSPDFGGRNLGVRPMEMLLMGMGGCTAIDVLNMLKRGREQIDDCVVELEAERAETDPKIFTRIRVHYLVTGRNLSRAKVERAVQLSAEKYCSASIMLGKSAEIEHVIEIRETNGAAADAA